MIAKLCERCKRRIRVDAVSCICGWSLASSRPRFPASPPPQLPSWEESKWAFEKVKRVCAVSLEPKVWTREMFVAHYHRILADTKAAPFAKRHAREALKNFGREIPQQREPGQDDEELAA